MGRATHDSNSVPTIIGVDSNTFLTPTEVAVDPITHAMLVSATVTLDPGSLATSANQTSGGQKTQIVDGSGNVIGATSNALDINIKSGNPTTITATQATGTNLHTVVDSGTITTVTNLSQQGGVAISLNTGVRDTGTQRVTIATNDLVPVSDNGGSITVDNGGTFATQSAITAASGSFSSGALASGSVASGAVASGAVVDGAIVTLGAKTDAKSTATDGTSITAMQVLKQISASVQAPPSQAVTNTGTFATQSAITAASGSIASGAVASGAFASGSIAAGAIATGATSIAENEDVASAGADTGVKILAIQKATPADTAADGDYMMPQMSGGKLWVGSDLKQIAGTTVVNGGTAGSLSVGGMVANNGTINSAVNPILVGGQAVSSENTAGTTAKLGQFVTDLVGKLIVMPYANKENFVSFAMTSAMTGTTSTITLAAPASGLRNYITQITVSNSHATVGTDILIQDGNGGTTIYVIPAAPAFGGATLTFPVPLKQPTTATAIYVANVTTGSNTKVSLTGYTGS